MWVYDDTSSQRDGTSQDDRVLMQRCFRGDDDSGPNLGALTPSARQNGYVFMAENNGWKRAGARNLTPSGRVLAYFAELYDSSTPGVYDPNFFDNWRGNQGVGWPMINVSMGGARTTLSSLRNGTLTVCQALPRRPIRTRFVWLGIYSQTAFEGARFRTVVDALNRCTGSS